MCGIAFTSIVGRASRLGASPGGAPIESDIEKSVFGNASIVGPDPAERKPVGAAADRFDAAGR